MPKKTSNINQISRWKKLKEKLRHTFRFQIIEEETYDVAMVFELSLMNIIMIGSSIFMFFLIISFVIFSLTPIRFYTPGYSGGGGSDKKEIINLLQKTDELSKALDINDKRIKNIKNLLTDKVALEKVSDASKESLSEPQNNIVPLEPTEEEIKFRKQIEASSNKIAKIDESSNLKWSKPLNSSSKVLKNINGVTFEFAAKKGDKIIAPSKGDIVNISTSNGVTEISLLHNNGYLSILKVIGVALVQEGDEINMGDPIINITNKNTILQYELWYEGTSIDLFKLL